MDSSYPMWIDAETDVRLCRSRSKNRGDLTFDPGREGEPTLTLIGSLDSLRRLIIEADRQLTRWQGDLQYPDRGPGAKKGG